MLETVKAGPAPEGSPTQWSPKVPSLQLAWDASSLYALMFCPRYYDLTIRQGWRGDSTDMEFGTLAHGAMEKFDRALLEGKDFDAAQEEAVVWALHASGERLNDTWKPWGGAYYDAWKCSGENKYRPKSTKKCPNSLKAFWGLGSGPGTCPECGSQIVRDVRWVAKKPGKDRPALIRLIVWWTEDLRTMPIKAILRPDGQPATEVHFKVALPFHAKTGEPFWLCGHMDGWCEWGGDKYVRERKSTKSALGAAYWDGFSPNAQVDTYDLVANLLAPEYKFRGVVVEAAQTLESGARTGHHICYRTPDQRAEWLREIERWLRKAEEYARDEYWPMARSQCKFCALKKICSKDPGKRETFLAADFKKQPWNPLEER